MRHTALKNDEYAHHQFPEPKRYTLHLFRAHDDILRTRTA